MNLISKVVHIVPSHLPVHQQSYHGMGKCTDCLYFIYSYTDNIVCYCVNTDKMCY